MSIISIALVYRLARDGGADESEALLAAGLMAASNTLIQAMVPDRLRGRVMAVYSMMFMGMAIFSGIVGGAGTY